MDLDWDDLRYFLGAVRSGTLAGAARKMGVEHTTIGRRLSSLERSLGAPLVLRGPDGLKLTAVGEAAIPLVEAVEEAVAAVRAFVSVRRARVRLAVPSGITPLFTPYLAELHGDHPTLSLEILSGSRVVDLKKGEADLAIRVGAITDKELVAKKLGDSGWSLYASVGYLSRRGTPHNIEHLAGHDLIGYDPALSKMPAAQWIEAHADGAQLVLRSGEMTDMLAATLSGAGIAALSCLIADSEPKLVRLTPKVIASRPYFLVYRREAKLSREVRAVIRMVLEVMRENAARISGNRPS